MDLAETLAWCRSNHPPADWCRNRPLSALVLKYRDQVAAREFPYNSTVERHIIDSFKLTLSEDETRNLGTLVYLAQQYTRERDEKNDDLAGGWVPSTQDWLDQNVGRTVEVKTKVYHHKTGQSQWAQAKIKRMADGKAHLMLPRARNRAYSVGCKIRPVPLVSPLLHVVQAA